MKFQIKYFGLILFLSTLVSIEFSNAAYPSPPVFMWGCGTMRDIRIYDSQNQLIYNNTVSYCGQRQESSNPIIVEPNQTYRFEIFGICYQGTDCTHGMAIRVWIDLNVNESFNDAGEMIYSDIFTYQTTITGYFTIPESSNGKNFLLRAASRHHMYGYPPITGTVTGYGDYADIPLSIPLDITTLSLSKSIFCAGEYIDIPFLTEGTFNSGNKFIAQLSNSVGSFANPLPLDTIDGINSATFFNVKLPKTLSYGTGYRIRVIGTNPNIIGSNNGTDLTIFEIAEAIITGSDSVCSESVEIYYTSSESYVNYNWFAEGGTIIGNSHNENLTVLWDSPGIGKIKLVKIIQTSGCADSSEIEIIISPVPIPEIIGPDTVCSNTIAIFRGKIEPNITNQWFAPDGKITGSDRAEQLSISWENSGETTLKLIQKNILSGCADTVERKIYIINKPSPFINGLFNVCTESSTTYVCNDDKTLETIWKINGGSITDSSLGKITVTWNNEEGVVSIRLIQKDIITQCEAVIEKTVFKNKKPIAKLLLCPNPVYEFSERLYITNKDKDKNIYWSVKGGSIISGQNKDTLRVKWDSSGIGEVDLLVIDGQTGCSDTLTQNIKIIPKEDMFIFGSEDVCEKNVYEYITGRKANIKYNWNATCGTIIGSETDTIVLIKWVNIGKGVVKLVYTDTLNSLSDSITLIISINPLPKIIFDELPDICIYDQPLPLNQAKPLGGTYSGNGIESDFFLPIKAGIGKHEIKYSFTDAFSGCTNSESCTITVLQAPTQPQISQQGKTLISSSGFSYQWYKDNDLIENAINQNYEPDSTGYYTVIITGENGCKSKMSLPYYFDITDIHDFAGEPQMLRIYPNPTFDKINIEYSLNSSENVTLELYDILGNKIETFDYGFVGSGRHYEQIDMKNKPIGMYYLILKTSDKVLNEKFGVMR
ncbi:MAG: T9SS type A sorting domain-containing protein [bacterium]